MYDILFAVCSYFFAVYYTNVFHAPFIEVISTDYLAITNASFFVLLGSFAVGGSNNLIRLI